MKKIYSLFVCSAAMIFAGAQENQSQPVVAEANNQVEAYNPNVQKAPIATLQIESGDAFKADKSDPNWNANKHSGISGIQMQSNSNQSPFEAVQGLSEDVSRRDAYTKHYKNADGTYTAIVGSGPIHYQKGGSFYDIETKINSNADQEFPYANTANLSETYFGKNAQKGIKINFEDQEIKEFLNNRLYWESNGQEVMSFIVSNPEVTVNNEKAVYENLFGSISAEFEIQDGKKELRYIINQRQSLGVIPASVDFLVFSEDVQLPSGWIAEMSEDGIWIIDQSGKKSFLYEKPYSYDSTDGIEDENTIFDYTISGNLLTVFVKVKADWLLDSQRVFPVTVDPTSNYSASHSVSIRSDGNTPTNGTFGRDNSGSSGRWVQYHMSFDTSSLIAGVEKINSVKTYLYQNSVANWNSSNALISISTPDPRLIPGTFSYSFAYVNSKWYMAGSFNYLPNSTNVWINNELNGLGISHVLLNSRLYDYASIAVAPEGGGWSKGNIYNFDTHTSGSNKPYLEINYSDTCNGTPSTVNFKNHIYLTDALFYGTLGANKSKTASGYASGYQDFTGDGVMTRQIPGQVVNLSMQSNVRGRFKAWVDWNDDGNFDKSELVYDSKNILTASPTFGFIIPNGTTPGEYKIRIRVYKAYYGKASGNTFSVYYNEITNYDFSACEEFGLSYDSTYDWDVMMLGEAEDYLFEVVEDCPIKITDTNMGVDDGFRCGKGKVTLSAEASGNPTGYRWYTKEFGGTLLQDSASNTYETPAITNTTTYWVEAYNGNCTSIYRVPVVAKVSPTPVIDFEITGGEVCGEDSGIKIKSTGDKEEYDLFNETFDSGLGFFHNESEGYSGTSPQQSDHNNANWKTQPSPFQVEIPPYNFLFPAMSSNYEGGNFATSITDVNRHEEMIKRLVLTTPVDATNITGLKLEYDLYYNPYFPNYPTYSYMLLEIKVGSNDWETLKAYYDYVGNPGKWVRESIDMSSYQTADIQIQFTVYSMGDVDGWVGDIAAVDNIRLYGNRDVDNVFDWVVANGTIFNSDCSTDYDPNVPQTEVCLKPDLDQLEANEDWWMVAELGLANGCTASGKFQVFNDTKVWNPASSDTDWASTTKWKPATPIPTDQNCVIVRKTVNLNSGTDGLARNLVVKNTGKLTVKSDASLKVTDFVKNQASVDNFIVENNANLIQINDNAPNAGSITVNKTYNFSNGRLEYNYITSPVNNGTIKTTIYPTDPLSVQVYNEGNYYFYETQGPYVPGLAYAVQESPGNEGEMPQTGVFKGEFYNGILDYSMAYTGPGYNLVGNPYPSNLDIKQLYEANKGAASDNIDPNFYFWDNRTNQIHHQMGSGYTQNQYAIYNATTGPDGTGVSAPRVIESGAGYRNPTREVKVGTGFMLQALKPGVTLHFENSYRIKTGTVDYTGKPGTEDEIDNGFGRYWLTMNTPSGIEPMLAVVYFEGGNNDFAIEDTESSLSSNDIYTFAGNKKLVIQGKAPFVNTDQIPLGYKAFEDGTHIFSVYQPEGVFENGQSIYLIDKLLNKTVKITDKPYKFMTRAGEFNDRFVIVYRPGNIIGTAADISNVVNFAKVDNQIVITSSIDKIKEVELFDLNSRPVYKKSDINSNEHRINAADFNHQIVIVTVKTETGELVTRKFVNN